MAEILLSLTIIGVVAAITLPSLTGNINERTWNTQRKALFARFSQAMALMPALNGYGTLTEDSSAGASDAVDTAAETFISNGLSKVLKINNICDNEHLADCGLPATIIPYSGSSFSFPTDMAELNDKLVDGSYSAGTVVYSYSQINTKAAAFETANGESIATYYNPYCRGDMKESTEHNVQPLLCVNFIYDLNGNKGPNTFGKDIGFISVLYPSDPVVVAPLPVLMSVTSAARSEASNRCKSLDSEYRLPNIDELTAMFYNKRLFNSDFTSSASIAGYWSASISSNGGTTMNWIQHFGGGFRYVPSSAMNYYVHCVKR